MRTNHYFDLRAHLRELNRFVFPFFFILCAVVMLILISLRAGKMGPRGSDEGHESARIGLLRATEEALFDPAFAVLSPIELVLAPTATSFDLPVGSEHGALTYNAQPFQENRHLGDDFNGIGGQDSDLGDPVFAVADGQVIFAGAPSPGWGNVVMLLHETGEGEIVESVYGHLDAIRVPVGGQVRRGDVIGTIGSAKGRYLAHLHFELRRAPALDTGVGYGDTSQGRLDGEKTILSWRHRRDDQLAAAPAGEPLEPSALSLGIEKEVPVP
ncbi:MAG: M23 family metallopeptidase [Verrucomicrobiales bacterium]|nr:M23 family metallopeptidase [Verrucomicrobiales bacterium]MDP5006240.1 M23 family metallopeptidase [Verrucomicrobiales bacterium]